MRQGSSSAQTERWACSTELPKLRAAAGAPPTRGKRRSPDSAESSGLLESDPAGSPKRSSTGRVGEEGELRDLLPAEREREHAPGARAQVAAEGRLAVRAGRAHLQRRAADLGAVVEERGDRPPAVYSNGSGGIVSRPSSLSSATMRAVSPASTASLKRATSSRSAGESGSGARSRSGRRRSSVARARCSAAFTDCGVTSSMAATSSVRKPSASRSTSAARCRSGRCWSAATNASCVASRCS